MRVKPNFFYLISIKTRFRNYGIAIITLRRKNWANSSNLARIGEALARWKTKRLGIIDLGTNSVRFDVHETLSRDTTKLLHREKLMVRLGENVFISGRLDSRACRRTLQALSSFKRRADELKVDKLVAFATSALRDASDSEQFIFKIRKTLGIEVHLISGKEEATLIAEGILSREKHPKNLFALVDIGGGSTEISVCRGKEILECDSFPLGVARLQQIFLRSIPPENGKVSVKHLRGHIRTVLRATLKEEKWPKVPHIIGSSGTIRALGRMCKRNTGKNIHPKWLEKLIRTMVPLNLDEIRNLPGMDPKRADLMLAGTLVLDECLRLLGADAATATEFSLRDGILDQELRLIEPTTRSGRWDLEPYLEKAVRYGEDPRRVRWLVGSSIRLFRRLRPVHKLDDKWFPYFALGLMFRNTGRSISPTGYEHHSAYIVEHGELPLSESWEIEFVAQLCLHHSGTKANFEKFPFQKNGSKARGSSFAKILALIRIVDALDSAYPKRVEAERIEIKRRTVRIWLSHGDSTELALLRVQQKKALFEKVFGRELRVQIR